MTLGVDGDARQQSFFIHSSFFAPDRDLAVGRSQSWEVHPEYCLPETDPTTFTGLIDVYLDATT